ncbi:MAG: hypothetical protein ACYTG7_16315 [Planctomycetota bacterium]|jgi:hypothetical protein
MTKSFQRFMQNLIDYAGLFPPAKLELDPAIRNYAKYRGEASAWMLGRFIIPAARLKDLEPYDAELFSVNPPFQFSVLLGAGPLEAESLQAARRGSEEIRSFLERHEGRADVGVLETRFPGETAEAAAPERIGAYLLGLEAALTEAGIQGMELFAEVPPCGNQGKTDAAAAAGIASFSRALASEEDEPALTRCGFKLRCGGLEAAAFPAAERIAKVVTACRKEGIALKCTAGLHHPLRRFDEEVGVHFHGFFNVFGAALLANGLSIEPGQIEACLLEEEAAAFRFDEGAFAWRDHSLAADDIGRLRRERITSFGSCSFDEPREDLQELKLLKDSDSP